MKIALIIPRNSFNSSGSFYDYNFYSTFLLSKKYLSYLLAIPTLTALTPEEHEIRIFDEYLNDLKDRINLVDSFVFDSNDLNLFTK